MAVYLKGMSDYEYETSRLLRNANDHLDGHYVPRYYLRELRRDAKTVRGAAIRRFKWHTKHGHIEDGDMYLDYILLADRALELLDEA